MIRLVRTNDTKLAEKLFDVYGGKNLPDVESYRNVRNWPFMFVVQDIDDSGGRKNIGVCFAGPIGGGKARVTVMIDPEHQGKGYNGKICDAIAKTTGYSSLQAVIKKSNEKSIKSFLGSGFRLVKDNGSMVVTEKQYNHGNNSGREKMIDKVASIVENVNRMVKKAACGEDHEKKKKILRMKKAALELVEAVLQEDLVKKANLAAKMMMAGGALGGVGGALAGAGISASGLMGNNPEPGPKTDTRAVIGRAPGQSAFDALRAQRIWDHQSMIDDENEMLNYLIQNEPMTGYERDLMQAQSAASNAHFQRKIDELRSPDDTREKRLVNQEAQSIEKHPYFFGGADLLGASTILGGIGAGLGSLVGVTGGSALEIGRDILNKVRSAK